MRYAMSLVVAFSLAGANVSLAADGAAIFKQHCASCHGETGKADTAAGKAMKVPALAGDAKVAGMADADIAAVAAYVKGLAAAK